MQEQLDKLLEIVEQSNRVLITSHLGPDADSLCSQILLCKILANHYPGKDILVVNEENMPSLNYLDGYELVKIGGLADAMAEFKPELFIILDANNIPRCSRSPEAAREYIKSNGVKTVIIDHHQPVGKDESDVYINQGSPAVTQDVYEIFIEQLKMKKPDNYAGTALLGIYSDTGGFVYHNPRYEDTFRVVTALVDDGADIEKIANKLNQYTSDGMTVLVELLRNTGEFAGATCSFISDEFTSAWIKEKKPSEALKEGFDIFLHQFIRNIDDRHWGFALYQDLNAPVRTYSVSFRSLNGSTDVEEIARSLGGGGHKPAAGAKLEVESMDIALETVKRAVSSSQN